MPLRYFPLSVVLNITLLLLCSCTARIPEPATYPYSQQQKSQAAGHWNVLARDVANRINEQLVLSGNADKSLYVEYNCGSDAVPCKENETSPFNEAFRDLLITNLYALRIPTMVQPDEEALNIDFKVQTIRHASRRVQTVQPGVITAISAGIAVLRNAPANLLLMATGTANKGEYFFRSSDIYYINDPDFWHYMETFPDGGPISFSSITLKEKDAAKKRRLIPRVTPVPPAPEKRQQMPTRNNTKFKPAEKIMKKKSISLFLLVLLIVTVTGCTRRIGCSHLANVYFLGTVEDLNKFSIKAADDLIENARPLLVQRNPNLPIFITTFVDDNDLSQTNAFGRILQKAISNRLVSREFPVRETLLGDTIFIEPRRGETILTRDLSRLAKMQNSQAVVVGTWSRTGRTLYLSVRAVNPVNNFIISARSYRLCMDDDILELFHLKTKKKIREEIAAPSRPLLNRVLPFFNF